MAMVFGIVVFVYLAFLFKRGDHDPEDDDDGTQPSRCTRVKDGGGERAKELRTTSTACMWRGEAVGWWRVYRCARARTCGIRWNNPPVIV